MRAPAPEPQTGASWGGAELCPWWSLRNGARVALLTGAGGCHRPWLGLAAKMYSLAMCIAAERWAPWAWGVLVGHRAGAVGAYMVGGGWDDHRVGARGSHGVGAEASLWLWKFTQYLALVLRSVTDKPNYINMVNLYLLFINSHPGLSPKGSR